VVRQFFFLGLFVFDRRLCFSGRSLKTSVVGFVFGSLDSEASGLFGTLGPRPNPCPFFDGPPSHRVPFVRSLSSCSGRTFFNAASLGSNASALLLCGWRSRTPRSAGVRRAAALEKGRRDSVEALGSAFRRLLFSTRAQRTSVAKGAQRPSFSTEACFFLTEACFFQAGASKKVSLVFIRLPSWRGFRPFFLRRVDAGPVFFDESAASVCCEGNAVTVFFDRGLFFFDRGLFFSGRSLKKSVLGFVFGSRPSEASGLFSNAACVFLTDACGSVVLFFKRPVFFGRCLKKSVLGGVFGSLRSEASGLFSPRVDSGPVFSTRAQRASVAKGTQ